MCGEVRQPALEELKDFASTFLDREVVVTPRALTEEYTFAATPGMRLNVLAYQRIGGQGEPVPVISSMWFGYGSDHSGFNAKFEGIVTKPTWAEDFGVRRCLVPVIEFKEARVKFGSKSGDLSMLAAIFTKYETASARHLALITRAAYGSVAGFHERMPMAVDTEHANTWLNREHLLTAAERLEFVATKIPMKVRG